MTYSFEIIGNWFRGYWVVTYVGGREGCRVGPFQSKREARETVALQQAAYRRLREPAPTPSQTPSHSNRSIA